MWNWSRTMIVLTVALVATALNGCASTPRAGHPNWERLGAREVNWRVDRDAIRVTASEGAFTKLQFRVARAPIEIFDCTVFYRDGSKQKISLRNKFAAGTASRVIDLAGNRRIITKVEFTYRKLRTNKATPKVVLYGRH